MMLSFTRPLRNRYLFISDIVLLTVAAYASYVLRLETLALGIYWSGFFLFTGLALVVLPLIFVRAGVYARYWRYASVEELVLLAGSVSLGALLVGSLSLLTVKLLPVAWSLPRSIPLIFLLLALVATAGPRFLLRLFPGPVAEKRSGGKVSAVRPQLVLIMGAGDAGAMIVRELKNNPHLGLEPIGFLDDDLDKHNVTIHGVPVLGDRHAIATVAHGYNVTQVIIAMPTAPGKEIRDIMRICSEANVQARIIPGIYELLGGTVSVNQLRDVRIEDLLRREPVQTDIAAVEALLRGKRVLVTGGGGSIGAELCRQILGCHPAELVLLGHGENSIFDITIELNAMVKTSTEREAGKDASHITHHASRITPIIADVRFPERIRTIFKQYKPEIIFHAAAHKHVPLMESNEVEAVTNNVLGTRNVVEAATAVGVERFVMISTDKAVNPSSVMGCSKRVAEYIVQAAARKTARPYVAVRFGNVLGSRGSVIPFFQKQIAAGGPVTVTHPDMKRYFMTIPEAVQLVLQAAVLGQGGEVFVLDMGEPVRIADLARDLIELSGLEVGHDIEIEYTGLRPGEKLVEELFLGSEAYARTQHEMIFACCNGGGEEGRSGAEEEDSTLNAGLDALIAAAERNDPMGVRRLLRELVPEYQEDAGAE